MTYLNASWVYLIIQFVPRRTCAGDPQQFNLRLGEPLAIKKRSSLIAIILYIVGLIPLLMVAAWIGALVEERIKQSTKDEALTELLLAKSSLEASLFRDVFLSDSLATVFSIDPEDASKNFQNIGSRLIERSQNVRNVGIAPNDVVEKILPLKGNERAVGLDFRTVPSQYKTVKAARDLKDVFLAGPLELVQGGRAVIARLPIFYDYPRSENYWGSISVVIDYDRLMNSAGLLDIENAKVALRGVNGLGEKGEVFEGDKLTFEQSDYQGTLIVPNGEWAVAAKFDATITQTQSLLIDIGWLSLLFLYTLIFFGTFMLWRSYQIERSMANRDALTQLFNRRFSLSYLENLMSKRKPKKHFYVLVIDLNRFKEVNDKYGHDVGDSMLQLVANGLEKSVRASDIVARMGGDEFLVIVNRVETEEAITSIIENIKKSVESESVEVSGSILKPSLSIGFASNAEGAGTPKDLLKLADQRMYEDKSKG